MYQYDLIVLGGGAAGFFGALRYKELKPDSAVLILERGAKLLEKVRISGGGRCNVTHACFEPHQLVSFYPRGEKELLGPFTKFHCEDTMQWFHDKGVRLKTEPDGRVFPVSNDSSTIINCFLHEAEAFRINIKTSQRVDDLVKDDRGWRVCCGATVYYGSNLLVATGSSQEIWHKLANLGHTIVPPVPSLFTFQTKTKTLRDLSGVTINPVALTYKAPGLNYVTTGPLLITHQGISGPAVLKLSAWCARSMASQQYQFRLMINWINYDVDDAIASLQHFSRKHSEKQLSSLPPFDLPGRWWKNWLSCHQFDAILKWKSVSDKLIGQIGHLLTADELLVHGKNTHKDEFVTAGGVDLKEVNTKSFESKLLAGLYLAGEVLNIDALTGGFNFQAAWTTAWIAGSSAAQ